MTDYSKSTASSPHVKDPPTVAAAAATTRNNYHIMVFKPDSPDYNDLNSRIRRSDYKDIYRKPLSLTELVVFCIIAVVLYKCVQYH